MLSANVLSRLSLSDEAHAITEWFGDSANPNNKTQILMNDNFKEMIIKEFKIDLVLSVNF